MIFENPGPTHFQDDIPRIDECRVLVIDDSHLTCKLIKTRLEAEGINHIAIAYDGKKGLEALKSFKPDLLILDIQMPELDGREVLRLIRSKPHYDNLPIIIESALDGVIDREELVEMGATNIIGKPINHNLLAMRARAHLERQLLIQNLRNYRQRLSHELEMARRMQADLLPSETHLAHVSEKHGIGIESFYRPSSELGGDFWTLHSLNDQHIAILMIDFAGHGIGASINTFRLNMILRDISPIGKTPSQFMERLNAALCRILGPTEFATAFYGLLDSTDQTFAYAAAGSPPVLATHPDTHSVETTNSRGVPLGINAHATYELRHIELETNSDLIFYSDAFPETRSTEGGSIGTEGMIRLITNTLEQPSESDRIKQFLANFSNLATVQPDDDMTLIWLKCQAK